MDQIDFAGVPGTAYFDNAGEHDLWRDDSMQNVEINLRRNVFGSIGNCCCAAMANGCGGCDGCNCCPWDLSFLVGARYFRFEDSILLGALQQGCTWDQGGGNMAAFLGDTVVNNLYGVQVGFDAAYRFCNNWKICVRHEIRLLRKPHDRLLQGLSRRRRQCRAGPEQRRDRHVSRQQHQRRRFVHGRNQPGLAVEFLSELECPDRLPGGGDDGNCLVGQPDPVLCLRHSGGKLHQEC